MRLNCSTKRREFYDFLNSKGHEPDPMAIAYICSKKCQSVGRHFEKGLKSQCVLEVINTLQNDEEIGTIMDGYQNTINSAK